MKLHHKRMKPISGYDDDYWITEDGNIISFKRKEPHVLKLQTIWFHGEDFLFVNLSKNGRARNMSVEFLLRRYFYDNMPTKRRWRARQARRDMLERVERKKRRERRSGKQTGDRSGFENRRA